MQTVDCPTAELLARLLDDTLDGSEAGPIEHHVEHCRRCQEDLERLTSGGRSMETSTMGPLSPDPGARPEPPPGHLSPGEAPRIAGYQIERELGRGGMGVVYLARQTHANRLVALKTVQAGRGRPEDLVRFRVEAESLARLRHPNIVQVHEVGVADGQPFFTMEYVEGGTLADALAEGPRPPREAAALLETIAAGVHAAHQCGVIHRDLKPANILIPALQTDSAGGGPASGGGGGPSAPKVTDFGLAKHVGDGEGLTHTGQILGTPEYMAPEQATGGAGVGVPADLYAMGAMLFELLTGSPPFRADSPWETMMRVVHDPVPRPSRHRPGIPRDLEVICLKCLEKSPAARYASADALAEDLRRYLAGLSILASPAGPARRLLMWCRRRPAAAALALLLAGSVATGAVGVALQWVRAERERGRAEAFNHFLIDDLLLQADPWHGETAPKPDVEDLLDRAGAAAPERFAGDPALESDVRAVLAQMYFQLRRLDRAEEHLAAARELARRAGVEESPAIHRTLGLIQTARGDFDSADKSLATCLTLSRARFGEHSVETAEILKSLAQLRRAQGRPDDTVNLYSEAVTIARRLHGAEPAQVMAPLGDLALALQQVGRVGEADRIYRGELAECSRLLGPDDLVTLAVEANQASMILDQRQDPAEAEVLLRHALAGFRKHLAPDHPEVVAVGASLSTALVRQEKYAEAEPIMRQGVAAMRARLGDDKPDTLKAINGLANVLRTLGDLRGAEEHLRSNLEICRKTLPPGHPGVVASLVNLAGVILEQGRNEEAEAFYLEGLPLSKQYMPPDHTATRAILAALASIRAALDDPSKGAEWAREWFAASRRANPPGHWETADAEGTLGWMLALAGEPEAAEPHLLAGERALAQASYAPARELGLARRRLIDFYTKQNRPDEANRWRDATFPAQPFAQ
jgi:tetratricopeptide (TPR) repeat protein